MDLKTEAHQLCQESRPIRTGDVTLYGFTNATSVMLEECSFARHACVGSLDGGIETEGYPSDERLRAGSLTNGSSTNSH